MEDESKNSAAATTPAELSPELADQLAEEFRPSWAPEEPGSDGPEMAPESALTAQQAHAEKDDPLADLELSPDDLAPTVLDPPRNIPVPRSPASPSVEDGNPLEELIDEGAPGPSDPASLAIGAPLRANREWGVRTHSTDGPTLWRFAAIIAVAGLAIVGSTIMLVRWLRPTPAEVAGSAASGESATEDNQAPALLARGDSPGAHENHAGVTVEAEGEDVQRDLGSSLVQEATLQLRLVPPDAQALIDGTVYAAGVHRLPVSSAPRRIVVSRSGFVERHLDLVVDQDRTLDIALAQVTSGQAPQEASEDSQPNPSTALEAPRAAQGTTKSSSRGALRRQRIRRQRRAQSSTMEGIWEAMERATKTPAQATGGTQGSGFTRNNPY